MALQQTHTVVVGASISGLACAACLQKKDIPYIIIEKQGQAGAPWRHHYERLHLHTNKRISNLPYKKFERATPRYPSRQQVVDYLESYQKAFDIHPLFNNEVISIKREDDHWITITNSSSFRSKYVIMATGAYGKPKPVQFKGMETFEGTIIHSYNYKTGKDFKGQKVLVVGFGNSACEIAIDLYEQGATPFMAVRSAVNVIPRDIVGIPVLELSLLMRPLSARVADAINAPLIRWIVGDLSKLGLRKKPYGPLEQIQREAIPPVLDIGTIDHIRKDHIKIHGDIDHIEGPTVYFKTGARENFDAIVAAIGYERNYGEILHINKSRFDDLSFPTEKQKWFGEEGLYFCGYWISPTGQIREIALDAKRITTDILKRDTFQQLKS